MKNYAGGINPSIEDDPVRRKYWEYIKNFMSEVQAALSKSVGSGNLPSAEIDPDTPTTDLTNYLYMPGRFDGQYVYGAAGGPVPGAWPSGEYGLVFQTENSADSASNAWEVFYRVAASTDYVWGVGSGAGSSSSFAFPALAITGTGSVGINTTPSQATAQLTVRGDVRHAGSLGLGSYDALLLRSSRFVTGGANFNTAPTFRSEVSSTSGTTYNMLVFESETGSPRGALALFVTNQALGSETARLSVGNDLILSGMDTASDYWPQATGGDLTIDFARIAADGAFTLTKTSDIINLNFVGDSGISTKPLAIFGELGTIYTVIDATGFFSLLSTTTAGGMFMYPGGFDGDGVPIGNYVRLRATVATANRTQTLIDATGNIILDTATQTLTNKTLGNGTIIQVGSSVGSGTRFQDNITTSKQLNILLNNAVGNNAIDCRSSAGRTWAMQNVTGKIPVVGDDDPAVASGALGKLDLTAQSAAIGSTNLTNGAVVGFYAIHYEMTCTTGDATAGSITFDTICTGDQGAQTISSAALPLTTATASATNPVRGTIQRYLASGELSYTTTVTGAVNNARYALRARVEFLG